MDRIENRLRFNVTTDIEEKSANKRLLAYASALAEKEHEKTKDTDNEKR